MTPFNPKMDPAGGKNADLPQTAKIMAAKNRFANLVTWLEANLPDSKARAIAITQLETSCMWTTRAIVDGGSA